MVKVTSAAVFVLFLGLSTAIPAEPILRKLDPQLRYQYEKDGSGEYHLVDLWMTASDLSEAARYDPITQNVYHLFTRKNPSTSQPLLMNNPGLLEHSNFDRTKRTIVLMHGWRDNAASTINNVLAPPFLTVEDVNVIVVDWSSGAGSINYATVLVNTLTSGFGIAQFIKWLNAETGSNPVQYHIVGHGLGGHLAGIVGRHLEGQVSYITALDPALAGWINHSDRFQENDGLYTEVIHTNCGAYGYLASLAQVDFYPNGGESMPGCDSHSCDHDRAIFYFAESIVSGGFNGKQCINYLSALLHSCTLLPGKLNLGGLRPKIGSSGVYYVTTNASPPFSRD